MPQTHSTVLGGADADSLSIFQHFMNFNLGRASPKDAYTNQQKRGSSSGGIGGPIINNMFGGDNTGYQNQ
jgi:hypothetical protein